MNIIENFAINFESYVDFLKNGTVCEKTEKSLYDKITSNYETSPEEILFIISVAVGLTPEMFIKLSNLSDHCAKAKSEKSIVDKKYNKLIRSIENELGDSLIKFDVIWKFYYYRFGKIQLLPAPVKRHFVNSYKEKYNSAHHSIFNGKI